MSKDVLKANVESLKKQLGWLERSYKKCKKIGIRERFTGSQFDNFETLSGRFARSIDFLVRRVFRSLDDLEFESQGSLIDVVNNAHKRGLFQSLDEFSEMRDLRNDIVHEYFDEELTNYFHDLLKYSPNLIAIMKNAIGYCTKYLK